MICKICDAYMSENKSEKCNISDENYCLPCASENLKKCLNCDDTVDIVYLSNNGVCTECITG